jgi:hypothetical protein
MAKRRRFARDQGFAANSGVTERPFEGPRPARRLTARLGRDSRDQPASGEPDHDRRVEVRLDFLQVPVPANGATPQRALRGQHVRLVRPEHRGAILAVRPALPKNPEGGGRGLVCETMAMKKDPGLADQTTASQTRSQPARGGRRGFSTEAVQLQKPNRRARPGGVAEIHEPSSEHVGAVQAMPPRAGKVMQEWRHLRSEDDDI